MREPTSYDVLNQLLYSTIRIETFNDDGVRTGFFYSITLDNGEQIPLIITNAHVIEGAERCRLLFHLAPVTDGQSSGVHEIIIDDIENRFVFHPDDIDLCALPIQNILNHILKETTKEVYFAPFSFDEIPTEENLKDFIAVEDIYMVGYPVGIWDEKNNLPVIRKGITASDPRLDFNERSRGVVDIAMFAGSSGSPVILFRIGSRYATNGWIKMDTTFFHLIGVLESAAIFDAEGELIEKRIPTRKSKVPITQIMVHLGYYIKSKEILALAEKVKQSMQ